MKKLRAWWEANMTGNRRIAFIVVCAVCVFVLAYSIPTLTTKPRIWTDEAVSLSIARSFSQTGVLDMETAPGVWYEKPALVQSTGYPVTAPLGVLFRLFGFDFTLARVYMLAWMFLALYALYRLAKKSFDIQLAVLGLVLVATFASFYGSGRTVVGEIPGFALLMFALYAILEERAWVLGGLAVGFAVVTKPSVFLLVLPALLVVLIREPRRLVRRGGQLALGMLPAAVLWFALIAPQPFSSSFWQSLAAFYQNPYSSSISENIAANLSGFFHATTLIYFSVLFAAVIAARFWVRRKQTAALYDFAIAYAVFAFVYYLRSPGWLRYLLIAELLVLVIIPHAVFTLLHVCQRRAAFARRLPIASAALGVVALLAVVQTVHLFWGAQLYYSDAEITVASLLDRQFSDKRVAVLGDASTYALLRNPNRELVLYLTGMPVIGTNPLRENPLPDVVVTGQNRFRQEGEAVLAQDYRLSENVDGYDIFVLKP